MDPKRKPWDTGLVCDKCHRKAVALTFYKAGDVWDKSEETRSRVGHRFCNACTMTDLGYLHLITRDKPASKWSDRSIFVALAFFTASWILLITQTYLALSAVLFLFFIGSIVAHKMLGPRKQRAWLSQVDRSAPLINTAEFLELSVG